MSAIVLHPLTLINISDHFMRCKGESVFGALLGQHSGKSISIVTSYALKGHENVDHEFFLAEQEQYKIVFPNLEFLGWYRLGTETNESDLGMFQQLKRYSETPILLTYDPSQLTNNPRKELPVKIFETVYSDSAGTNETSGKNKFMPALYVIDTKEEERIAIESVMKSSGNGDEPATVVHLTNLKNAVVMLHNQVKLLYSYVLSVKSGEIKMDHNVFRQISSLCSRLPIFRGDSIDNEFIDSQLVSLLSLMTKGLYSLNTFSDNVHFESVSKFHSNKPRISDHRINEFQSDRRRRS